MVCDINMLLRKVFCCTAKGMTITPSRRTTMSRTKRTEITLNEDTEEEETPPPSQRHHGAGLGQETADCGPKWPPIRGIGVDVRE